METSTPTKGPAQPYVQQGPLVLDGGADLDEGPKGADDEGNGRGRDEEGQGDVELMPPGHQVMAHFVSPQDQEQGEGKRDAPVQVSGMSERVHPLLESAGDDGGGHRGQQQHQMQPEPLAAYRRPAELAPEFGPLHGRLRPRGLPGSLIRVHFRPTSAFKAASSAVVSGRYIPRAKCPRRKEPRAIRFSFETGCPTFSIRRFTR